MEQITTLTNNPNYTFTQPLPNGEEYIIHLYYLARQQYWIIDLTYKKEQINGRRVVATKNIYNDKTNILPYGIAVLSKNGLDPTGLEAFTIRDAVGDLINTMYIVEKSEYE